METILQYQRPRNTKDRIDFCVTEWFKRNGVFLICGNWKWLTRFESTFTPLSEKNLRASFAGGLKNRMNNTRKKKKNVYIFVSSMIFGSHEKRWSCIYYDNEYSEMASCNLWKANFGVQRLSKYLHPITLSTTENNWLENISSPKQAILSIFQHSLYIKSCAIYIFLLIDLFCCDSIVS